MTTTVVLGVRGSFQRAAARLRLSRRSTMLAWARVGAVLALAVSSGAGLLTPSASPAVAQMSADASLAGPWCTPGDGTLLQPGQLVTCAFVGAPNVSFGRWATSGFTVADTSVARTTFVAGGPQPARLAVTQGTPFAPQRSQFGYVIAQSVPACNPTGLVLLDAAVTCSFIPGPGGTFLGWSAPTLDPPASFLATDIFSAVSLGDTQITATWQEGGQALQFTFPVQVSRAQLGCSVVDGAAIAPSSVISCGFGGPADLAFLGWQTTGLSPAASMAAQETFTAPASAGIFAVTATWREAAQPRSWTIHLLASPQPTATPTPTSAATASPTSVPPTACTASGILDWWPGGGDGSDRVGGAPATLGANASFATLQGRSAFQFDGASGYVSLPLPSALRGSPSLSIALSFDNARPPAGIQMLLAAEPQNGFLAGNGVYLLEDGGNLQLLVQTPGSSATASASVPGPPAGVWHHVVATYDATSGDARIYLDGGLANDTTANPVMAPIAWADAGNGSPLPGQLYFGALNSGYAPAGGIAANQDFYGGALAQLQLYGRALAPSEVARLAAAVRGGTC